MSISDIKDRTLGACYDIFCFLCSPAGAMFIAVEIATAVTNCESKKTQVDATDKALSVQREPSKVATKQLLQKSSVETNQIHGVQR